MNIFSVAKEYKENEYLAFFDIFTKYSEYCSCNLNFQNFDFLSSDHGNTLFLVTMVTIGNIKKSLTQIMQHINTNICAN